MNKIKEVQEILTKINVDAILINDLSDVRYISGFTGSNANIIITKNLGIIITDSRYTEQVEKECEGYEVLQYIHLLNDIKKVLEEQKVNTLAIDENFLSYKKYIDLRDELKDIKLISNKDCIKNIRQQKEVWEIDNIKKAIAIGDRAFTYILDYIKVGVSEIDIAIELEYFMKKNGAEDLAFASIIASGERSAMPHATCSNRKIQKNDIVLMDYGCKYNGYCSDMTRTVFVGGIDEKLRKVYNIVLQANELAIDSIVEGIQGKEVDKVARDFICKNGYGDNFGHALGHSIGLEVHEKPTFSQIENERIKNNMLITVEPGIYIKGVGGVRIEDVILIKDNTPQILTKSTKDIIII